MRRLQVGLLGAALFSFMPRPVLAQAVPTGRLAGTVVDDQHHAIHRAEVAWVRAQGDVVILTDTAGHFSFGTVPSGSYRVAVRRLGYQPRTVTLTLSARGAVGHEVILEAMPVGLEAIRVVARVGESQGKLAEFYERRSRPNRLGYFLDEEQFGDFDYLLISDYLRTLPGVAVRPSKGSGNIVRFRGCQPMIWLDGLRMDDAEADELVLAREVAAIEVYVSPAGSPGRYRDLTKHCGSIVIWRKG
jgi:hypothetical protein